MTEEEHAKFCETHCWGCDKDATTGNGLCAQCDKEYQDLEELI